MIRGTENRRQIWPKGPYFGLAFLFAALVYCVAVLVIDVQTKLTRLATAQTDNAIWGLSQLEVEFLAFQNAVLLSAASNAPDLDQVTLRFDVFFSRVSMVNEAAMFTALRDDPELSGTMAAVTGARDRMAGLIDQGGAPAQILPLLLSETRDARGPVRDVALRSVDLFVIASEGSRARLSSVLTRLAVVSTVLVGGLIFALAAVARLVRRTARHARDLQRSTIRLQAVSATSLDAILVTDDHGFVQGFNAAAEQIFGYSAEQAIGNDFADLIMPGHLLDQHRAGMDAYHKGGKLKVVGSGRVRLEACRADGEVFPIELAITRTPSPEGDVFVAFMRDISGQVEDERTLRQARDDALAGEKAKANLLAVMSHEMRTPLNGILGSMELLARTDLAPDQREHLEIMSRSGDLLLHHVNDVLELSRLDAGHTELAQEAFDAGQVILDVAQGLRAVAKAQGTEIDVVLTGAQLDHVEGDERRLRQVLMNLSGNAVKFTENGRITISAARREDNRVEIAVRDTGIGIAPEDQARIFDEFVTIDPNYNRKVEGTGLGLAITRRLVEAMGGVITLESAPGAGSTFRVTLPLAVLAHGRRHADQSHGARDTGGGTIRLDGMQVLLVEDNPINRRIARAMLEPLGCVVTEACDGAQGVELANETAFDVILMDISMPRMDGIEATRHIRTGPAASAAARIIALTAHALEEDIARFKAAGMSEVILKPISAERLSQALDRRKKRRQIDPQLDAQVLDMAIFGEFAQVLGPEATAEMLAKFLADAEEAVPWLIWHASEEASREAVANRAHGLAGSAAVMGATALHGALRKLEAAARTGAPLAPATDALSPVWDATRDKLNTRSAAA
ncbi:MAG: ATP-binding protein [Pseudomonadota bacterium]